MYITMKIPAAHCHLVSCSLHTHRHHPPSTSIDRELHFRRFDLLVASKSTRGGRNKKTVSTLFMLLFCCVLLLSALDRIALCVLNYSINQIRVLGVWRPRRHSGVSPLAIKGSGWLLIHCSTAMLSREFNFCLVSVMRIIWTLHYFIQSSIVSSFASPHAA